jgi:hypothetical protein
MRTHDDAVDCEELYTFDYSDTWKEYELTTLMDTLFETYKLFRSGKEIEVILTL